MRLYGRSDRPPTTDTTRMNQRRLARSAMQPDVQSDMRRDMPALLMLPGTLLLLLFMLLFTLAPAGLSAQSDQAAQILVNYSEVPPNPDPQAQDVNVFFTLTDGAGLALPNPEISEAVITLNGQDFEAVVSVPTTPLNLVLILDLSGSMRPAAAVMREAAINAVNTFPQNSRMTLLTFNETVQTRVSATDDRNAVVNAIASIPDGDFEGGTCLYDSIFDGINALQGGSAGRRAVVVFTDGRDELIAGGELDPCSQRADFARVLGAARSATARVPLFTIGIVGAVGANGAELESLAQQTGGLSATGATEALNTLFQQIVQALNGQRQATARVCLENGDYSGSIAVQAGQSSNNLSAPITGIRLTTTCLVPTETPTPTATFTPFPLSISINTGSFNFNAETNELQFEVERTGLGDVTTYRVQIIDQNTGFQIPGDAGQFDVPIEGAPASTIVRFAIANIRAEELRIRVSALDANGATLATSNEGEVRPPRTDVPTETATTTPLPTETPTITPVPLAVIIESPRFSSSEGEIQVSVDTEGEGEVVSYRVEVINKATGLLVEGDAGQFIIEAPESGAADISVPIAGIDAQTVNIRVVALDADGRALASSVSQDVQPPRTNTPTPIPTETPTITPTPIVRTLSITGISFEEASNEFIINLRPSNLTLSDVTEYTVQVIDEGNIQRFQQTRTEALTNPLRLAAVDDTGAPLRPGQYRIRIEMQVSGAGQPVSAEDEVVRPQGPTPTPPPSGVEALVQSASENPVVAGGVVLVVLAIIGLLLFLFTRNRRTSKRGYEARSYQSGGVGSTAGGDDGSATTAISLSELRAAGGAATAPASLTLISGAPTDPVNQVYPLSPREMPFRIGRKGTPDYPVRLDLTDSTISTNHATIQYSNGRFSLVDDGSANGTLIDDEMLEKGRRYPLENGQIIRLGLNTLLRFDLANARREESPVAAASSPAVPVAAPAAPAPVAYAPAPAPVVSADGLPAGLNARISIVQTQDPNRQPGQSIPVQKRAFVIGRAPGNDLVIETDGVSKQHATLRYNGQNFTLEDMGSKNGTTLDGARISGQAVVLAAGREHNIMLGLKTRFQFTYNNLAGAGAGGAGVMNATMVEMTPTPVEATMIENPPAPPPPPPQQPPLAATSAPATRASSPTAPAYRPPARDDDPATMVGMPEPPGGSLPSNIRATLEIVRGFGLSTGVRPVATREVTMGRKADNMLVFDSGEISRNHARLYFETGRFYVEDRNSGNGTFVNDQPVAPGSPTALEPGTMYQIRLGKESDPALLKFIYNINTGSFSGGEEPATMT